MEWINAIGAEHLPLAVAIVVVGYTVIKSVVKMYQSFLGLVQNVVNAAIKAHLDSDHRADQADRDSIKAMLTRMESKVDALHKRQDEHLVEHARAHAEVEP